VISVKIFVNEDGMIDGYAVSGHSGTAARGQDIVCAGVSAGRILCRVSFERGSDISHGGVVWEFLDRFSLFKVNLRVMSKTCHHVLDPRRLPRPPRVGRAVASLGREQVPPTRGSPRTNHPRPHI